jgi:hypothetical protein
MMTDRDCVVATLGAVIALAERITGERLTVHVKTESGEEVSISGADVSWEPPTSSIIPARDAV